MTEPKEGIIQITCALSASGYNGRDQINVVYGLSNYGKTYKLENGEWRLIAGELN
jgi:hypothetical protein